MKELKLVIVWHGHHDAGSPLEFLDESFASRLKTINTEKAQEETAGQIKRRKKLFKPFKGTVEDLPVKVQRLWKKSVKEGYLYSHSITDALYGSKKVLALHKEQCGCGWTPKKPDIFSYEP